MRKFMLSAALLGIALNGLAWEAIGPKAPAVWESTALAEFTNWFGRVCPEGNVRVGGRNDIVFHIGDTERAKATGLASSSFKDEEWCVKSVGKDVVLNGGGSRGALYAVYHFLEDTCGVRWWNDDEYDVPTASSLELPTLDRRGRPFFRYRDIYRDYGRTHDPQTAVRLRLNGNSPAMIPLSLGGGVVYGPPFLDHTLGRYLPFEKYGKDHPEWYSYHKKNGKREGGMLTGQFCLSNKELLSVVIDKVKAAVREGEAKSARLGASKPLIYVISMNDNRHACECEACLGEAAKSGYSGQMIRFVNAIAAEVGRERPDLLFKTSAYLYTEEPPKDGTRAADNVLVDIATTTDNLAGPIEDDGCTFVRKSFEGWRSHAKNLLVWT